MASTHGTIYLIHFAEPFGHARHYLGWTDDLDARIARHRSGRGARLLAAVTAVGIAWDVARTWADATRDDERALKNRKGAPRLCPVCRSKKKESEDSNVSNIATG